MSQGRLITHWAVLMEGHYVAYTEVKEKSDIDSIYIYLWKKIQKAEVAFLTIIDDGRRKGSEWNTWRQTMKR